MASGAEKQNQVVIPGYLKVSKVISWLFYLWVVVGIAFLIMRVFLLATSANMGAGFSNFVYNVSQDYMQPFRGIFPSKTFGSTGYLDVSALFAIIVYLFLAWGFKALVDYVQNKIDLSEAEQKTAIQKAENMSRQAAQIQSQKAKPVPSTKKIA